MSNSKHVLIADENERFVDALALRCELLGVFVSRAYNDAAALQAIDEIFPDLVILEQNMPSGNGLNVCEIVCRDPELNLIPIILLTDKNVGQAIQSCHEQPGYCVAKGPDMWLLLKPILLELLGLEQPDENRSPAISGGVAKLAKDILDLEHSSLASHREQTLRPELFVKAIYPANESTVGLRKVVPS